MYVCIWSEINYNYYYQVVLGVVAGFPCPAYSYNDELEIGAPPGSNVCCNESGWMTKELFVKWLKHFHLSVKCTKEDTVWHILQKDVAYGNRRDQTLKERLTAAVSDQSPAREMWRLMNEAASLTFFEMCDRAIEWAGGDTIITVSHHETTAI